MKKFEYKIINLQTKNTGSFFKKETKDIDESESKIFAELGKNGWELVSVVPLTVMRFGAGTSNVIAF